MFQAREKCSAQKWNKPLESQITMGWQGGGTEGSAAEESRGNSAHLLYKVCQVLTLPEIPWEVIQRV